MTSPLPRPVALLLAGHGSHLSVDSSRPIHLLARRLRAEGRAREVRVGLWKEDPHLSRALDLVESRDVVVCPIFTSVGYFVDRVVPRELGLAGPITRAGGRTIRYTAPVGTHALVERIVLERAREASDLAPDEEARATLVVIGHGTDAHPESGEATRSLADRLGASGPFGRVEMAFLDQEPRLERVLDGLEGTVVLVPFFISEGWHVGTTIPEALGLDGPTGAGGATHGSGGTIADRGTRRGAATLFYGKAVGTHPLLAEAVWGLAEDALAWELPDDLPEGASGGASGAPGAEAEPSGVSRAALEQAKWDFLRWVSEGGIEGRVFLHTLVRASREGGFEIRHVLDRDRPATELTRMPGVDGAFEVAAVSATGMHRPLKTAPDLRTGWRVPRLGLDEVWEAYAHLYPTAPVHRELARRGKLPIVRFGAWAARQTGIYASAGTLGPEQVARVVERCCADAKCLRSPTWAAGGVTGPGLAWPPPGAGAPGSMGPVPPGSDPRTEGGGVPCPEPCSLFMASAREAAGAPP